MWLQYAYFRLKPHVESYLKAFFALISIGFLKLEVLMRKPEKIRRHTLPLITLKVLPDCVFYKTFIIEYDPYLEFHPKLRFSELTPSFKV